MHLFVIFGFATLAGIHGNAIPSNDDVMKMLVLNLRKHMNDDVEKLRKEGPKLMTKLNDKVKVKLAEAGLEIEAKLNNVVWDRGQVDGHVEEQKLNNNTFLITVTGTSKQGTFDGDLTITGNIAGREVNEERKYKLAYSKYWFRFNIMAPDVPGAFDGRLIIKTEPEFIGEDTKAEIIGEEIDGMPKDRLSKEIANEWRALLEKIVKNSVEK